MNEEGAKCRCYTNNLLISREPRSNAMQVGRVTKKNIPLHVFPYRKQYTNMTEETTTITEEKYKKFD